MKRFEISIYFNSCRMYKETVVSSSEEAAVMFVLANSMEYNMVCIEKFGSKMNTRMQKIEVEEI